VTPSHQFPTGVVLSMARRLELLAWARKRGAFIVEDDYTSEFRYSGPPLASLQGLDDSERVIYVGTLNKALFPGLRIGYAVVPHALLQAFVSARYLIDRQPPTLQQTVVAEFMQQGHFRRAYPAHATSLSRAARRAGEHPCATRVGSARYRRARSGHASRCVLARRRLGHRHRSCGTTQRHHGAGDQPLLSWQQAALRLDVG